MNDANRTALPGLVTGWNEDESWRYRDIAEERAAMAAFRVVIDYAAQIAAENRLERFGDGEGGVLFRELETALSLHLGHPLKPERDPTSTRKVPRALTTTECLAVFAKNYYMCQRCGTRDDLTVDHIHPVSKGGTNDPENLQTLCKRCNSGKRDRI